MTLRRKHLKIDQRKLDRVKELLRLPTEEATIDRALDAVLADELSDESAQDAKQRRAVLVDLQSDAMSITKR